MTRRVILTLAIAAALASWCATADAQQHKVDAETTPTAATGQGAAPAEHGGGGHGGADHKKYELLPDLSDAQTWYSALWVLIIFLVLLAVLYPTAWKNVLAGLKKREERIRNDIAEAEAARKRAEQTLKEYEARLAQAEQQIRDMIAKATAEGEQVASSIRARSQQEAEEAKERAARDIESARDQAIAELYEQAADLSVGVAEKILQRNINADDQRELVKRSLEQLQAAGAGKNGG